MHLAAAVVAATAVAVRAVAAGEALGAAEAAQQVPQTASIAVPGRTSRPTRFACSGGGRHRPPTVYALPWREILNLPRGMLSMRE